MTGVSSGPWRYLDLHLALGTHCARLTHSSCDVMYDHAHFPPQMDEARTDQLAQNLISISEETTATLQQNLKIYCEQYSTQGSEEAIKKYCIFACLPPFSR